ncbi:hypothetical protein CMV_002716 [Castanea mollissima]|uniref:Uncharacterized protein n=1 Tax=Castanea mollissima TaxID=60419 RepID=A0A8J4RIR1_9ROSI|nr:hypothetical protein CMV_002716 [Castanea mollissima]
MLDHRQGFTGKPLHSSSPKYQIQSSHDSTGDIEFDFWGVHDSDTMYNENFSDQFGTEIEFQVQASLVQEGLGGYSLPLWKRNSSKRVQYESSPLLPHNHHPSNLSPTSRRKIIADGRKQLMEMVKDMPESSYELSLKDLVDEQHSLEEVQEGPVESGSHYETGAEDQAKKQKKNTKKGIKKERIKEVEKIAGMEAPVAATAAQAGMMMPISHPVAGTSSTPTKTKLRDREDSTCEWKAVENWIGLMIIAELMVWCFLFLEIILW